MLDDVNAIPTELFLPKHADSIWLDTKEAAYYLRISVGSLRNLVSNGKVPYCKFNRLNRFLKSDLDKLLLANRRGL